MQRHEKKKEDDGYFLAAALDGDLGFAFGRAGLFGSVG